VLGRWWNELAIWTRPRTPLRTFGRSWRGFALNESQTNDTIPARSTLGRRACVIGLTAWVSGWETCPVAWHSSAARASSGSPRGRRAERHVRRSRAARPPRGRAGLAGLRSPRERHRHGATSDSRRSTTAPGAGPRDILRRARPPRGGPRDMSAGLAQLDHRTGVVGRGAGVGAPARASGTLASRRASGRETCSAVLAQFSRGVGPGHVPGVGPRDMLRRARTARPRRRAGTCPAHRPLAGLAPPGRPAAGRAGRDMFAGLAAAPGASGSSAPRRAARHVRRPRPTRALVYANASLDEAPVARVTARHLTAAPALPAETPVAPAAPRAPGLRRHGRAWRGGADPS